MNKLYGYYIGNNLTHISPNKELLQEILVDDYFENAFWLYNVEAHQSEYKNKIKDGIDFWRQEKRYHYVPKQYITTMEEYQIG